MGNSARDVQIRRNVETNVTCRTFTWLGDIEVAQLPLSEYTLYITFASQNDNHQHPYLLKSEIVLSL